MTLANGRFAQLLNAYWLRPESALFYEACFSALDRAGLGSLTNRGRSLDFHAMDGIPSAIAAGARFPWSFDAFSELGSDGDRLQERQVTARDYYELAGGFGPEHRLPTPLFECGIVFEDHHLVRAESLGAHRRVTLAGATSPLSEFSGEFDLVWAINLYWKEDLGTEARRLRRFLRAGGLVITLLPSSVAVDTGPLAWGIPSGLGALLDRGRSANMQKSVRTLSEARELFSAAGLFLQAVEPFAGSEVRDCYEVGLRPAFPALLAWRRQLMAGTGEDLTVLKSRMVHELEEALIDVVEGDVRSLGKGWQAFILSA